MYFELFLVFLSALFLGSVLESGYRSYEAKRFVSLKLWNLQMYVWIGFVLYFLYILEINFLYKVLIILLSTTGIEYLTGYLYTKYKKQKLWDYSMEKYNYKGIVCLRFSFYWLVLSLLYYFLFLDSVLKYLRT